MMSSVKRKPLACVSALVLSLAVASWAQADSPERNSNADAVVDERDQIILPRLEGLVFLSDMTDVQEQGVAASGIRNQGVALLQEAPVFLAQLQAYIGQPLSLNGLQKILDEVVVFAREQGYPVVDVLVPEQDVTTGSVQILVLEGRLGQVQVKGNRWFGSQVFMNGLRLQSGNPVDARLLDEDITWLNRNPFRQVDAVFVQGTEPGTTDIHLQIQERYPVRVFASYENTGNSTIGRDIWGLGINWGNVFETDHQAGYQYNRSGKDGILQVHGLDYVIPLAWRHMLTFNTSYATVDSELFNVFGLTGRSTRFSGRYWMPLDAGVRGLGQNLQIGFDYKRTNNNLEFFGTQVFDDTAEVLQLVLEYSGSMADPYGLNSWHVHAYNSPGKWTSENRDENFEAIRPGALAHYNYIQIGYDRLQRLPYDLTWAVSARAQRADGRLLASEQLGVGGRTSVRGFDERHLSGDHGFLLTNELRTRSYATPGSTAMTPSEVQGVLFVDWGKAQIANPLAGEAPRQELSSVGLGFRYQWGRFLTVQSDYGWQVTGRSTDQDDNGRFHIRILASY